MREFLLKEMQNIGADGVEFVPIFTDYNKPYKMYQDLRLEDLPTATYFPRSGRRYYRLEDGKKIYLDKNEKPNKDKDILKLKTGQIVSSGVNNYMSTIMGLEEITFEEKNYIHSEELDKRYKKLYELRENKRYEKICNMFKELDIDIKNMSFSDMLERLGEKMCNKKIDSIDKEHDIPNGCNLYSPTYE